MSDPVSVNGISFGFWLEENKSGKVVPDIKSSINVLDLLLMKNKLIQSRILQMTEPEQIGALAESIKKSKGIKIHSKRRRSAFLNALYVYKEYLEYLNSDTVKDDENSAKWGNSRRMVVSFTESGSYSYTRPTGLEYFGKHFSVKNWADLYVQTVKCLLRDYPEKMSSLIDKNISGRGCVDISEASGSEGMLAPKEVANDLYLETNCSSDSTISKIKQLLDICSVDYINVVITFVLRSPSSEYRNKLVSDQKTSKAVSTDTAFLNWMIYSEGLTEKTGSRYASAINSCDLFCREHTIGTGRIYRADGVQEAFDNIDLLITDTRFIESNRLQHSRFTAALGKYKKYLSLLTGERPVNINQTFQNSDAKVDLDYVEKIKRTLNLPRFEYGFKDDSVELFRFRNSYVEVNGEECDLTDVQLQEAIHRVGVEFDGKVFLISDETKRQLINDMRQYANSGVQIIYYELLYDSNMDQFFESKIISADMLKALLQRLLPDYRFKQNYFMLCSLKHTELELLENEILRVWGDRTLKTVAELSTELPLVPEDKLKFALSERKLFVWNSFETYTRQDLFAADEDEISDLTDYITEQCNEHGRISFDDLPLEDIRANNPELSEVALYNIVYRKVEGLFARNGKMLTKKGAGKDVYTAIIEFCKGQNKCTYEQLQEIAKNVAGVVRHPTVVDAGNATMIRVDKDNFVSDRFVYFDVNAIDTVLDKIVVSDFIGMKEITTFSIFPFCGYAWNLYLLESYCRRFSKKYQYEVLTSNSANAGAVVRKSWLLNYHDIMAHAIARSGMDLNEDEVYNFLTGAGYMKRKRYSNMDALINEAAKLRESRK